MASAEPVADAVRDDWLDRVFARAPLPAWLVGLAIGAGLAAGFLALTAASGELSEFLARGDSVFGNRNARLGLLLPLQAAWFLTAHRYLATASRRHLAWLHRATGTAPVPSAPRSGAAWIAAAALGLPPVIALLVDREPGLYLRGGYWGAGVVGNWLVGIVSCGALGRFAHATVEWSRAFSRQAEALPAIDLFDRGWLVPFASQGLFCALLWLAGVAIFTLNLGDDAFLWTLAPVGLVCGALGAASLWLPTAGVRRRLVEARDAELARVHRALRGDAAAERELAVGARDARPGLADLLAYARYLEALPTTPFRTANWLRFGLYLALPLGSWLGGALVERAVSTVLD